MAAVVFAAPGDVPNAATIRAASKFVRTLPSAPGAAALATMAPPGPQNKTPAALREARVSDDGGPSPPIRRRAARLTRRSHSRPPPSPARRRSPLHPNVYSGPPSLRRRAWTRAAICSRSVPSCSRATSCSRRRARRSSSRRSTPNAARGRSWPARGASRRRPVRRASGR